MRILTGLLAPALIAALIVTAAPVYAQGNAEFGKPASSAKKPAALDDGPAEAAPVAGIEIREPPPPAPLTMPAVKKANAEPFGPPMPPVPAAPAAEASDVIGTIVQVEGAASIHSGADGKDIKAADKAPVHLHDIVTTGDGARALILLIDNSHVTLGEKAAFTADTFAFDPDRHTGNTLKLGFPQGAFKYAGSEVDREAHTSTSLILPTGTAQVHGATIWGGPSTDGYSVFVLSGDISIITGRGRVTVRQGQGTSLRDARDTPSRPDAWPPERITAMIRETQINDAKSASAKMEQARAGQRTLIARYKAWSLLHPGEDRGAGQPRQPGTSRSIRPTPRTFDR